MVNSIFDDFRFSVRAMLRRPGLPLAAIVVLSLGIGGCVAVFSVLNGVILRPLAYPNADRITRIHRFVPPSIAYSVVSPPDLLDIADALDGLVTVAGYVPFAYSVGSEEGAERVPVAHVTEAFFDVFGLQPLRGRWLDRADQSGDTNGVVISSRYWRERFAGRDDAVGATVMVNGERWTVVGVAPPSMDYPDNPGIWLPMRPDRMALGRNVMLMRVIGRVHDGVSSVEVQERLTSLAARLAAEFPEIHAGLSLRAMRLKDQVVRNVRGNLWMLMAAVALVMLVACANVAGLLLSRLLAREQELMTRLAIGAHPARLARQAIVDAIVLGLVGASFGLALAAAATDALIAVWPASLPRLETVTVDSHVFVFAGAAALLTGVLCGILPALHMSGIDIAAALRGGRVTSGTRHISMRRWLVIGQIALSMVLLVASSLVFETLRRLSEVDPGFDTRNLLTATITLPEPFVLGGDQETYRAQARENAAFLAALSDALGALPGVNGVAAVDLTPLSGETNLSGDLAVPGVAFENGKAPVVEYRWVTRRYFSTLGIPLLAGEDFTAVGNEGSASRSVVLVNRALAESVWPSAGDAVGKQIVAFGSSTIAGVVGNTRQWGLDRDASPEIYYLRGTVAGPDVTTIVLRTSVDPLTLIEPLRRTVAGVNAQVPVFDIRTMEQIVGNNNARRTLALVLLSAFSAIAAVVAAVGLYGVMANAVIQRRHEIGVRIALGADRSRIVSDFLKDATITAIAGIALGAAMALLFERLLHGLVWGVEGDRPWIYLATAAFLVLVALTSSLAPARRVSGVASVEALRHE